MSDFIRTILGLTKKVRGDKPADVTAILYKDGVKRVCSSLHVLFAEFERTGIISPWHVSSACRAKREDKGSTSSACYHVVAALSGVVYEYARRILREQLLSPLLNTKTCNCLLDEQDSEEYAKFEESCLRDALVQWFKTLGLDWLRAVIRTRQFVDAFSKSKCVKFCQTDLGSTDGTFFSEEYLRDFCGNEQCAISYISGTRFLEIEGLISGFLEETVRKYKADINSSGLLSQSLII